MIQQISLSDKFTCRNLDPNKAPQLMNVTSFFFAFAVFALILGEQLFYLINNKNASQNVFNIFIYYLVKREKRNTVLDNNKTNHFINLT